MRLNHSAGNQASAGTIRSWFSALGVAALVSSLVAIPAWAGGRPCAWDMALRELKSARIQDELRYPGMPEEVIGACRVGDRAITALAFAGYAHAILAAESGPNKRDAGPAGRIVPIKIDAGRLSPREAVAGNDDYVCSFASQLQGPLVAAGGARWDRSLTISQWDYQSGQSTQKIPELSAWWLRALAFSPDGKLLATQAAKNDSGPVRLWKVNASTGQVEFQTVLPGPAWAASALAFSPDGRFLVAGLGSGHRADQDGELLVWDLRKQTPDLVDQHSAIQSTTDSVTRRKDVTALAFTGESKLLASGDQDGAIQLWHWGGDGQLQLARNISAQNSLHAAVRTLGTTRHGRLLSAGGESKVKLWDPQTGKNLRTFQFPEPITAAILSPDAYSAAIGLANGVAYILNVRE